jgi:Zn finger protein HypA/HybF involved in hydrogenase expression
MHEYGLMEQVVANILAELKNTPDAPAGQALQVRLTVGALAVHAKAAAVQAFTVLSRGTPLEGCRLDLILEPATAACPQCGCQDPLAQDAVDPHDLAPLVTCPRCGAPAPVQGSRGVENIQLSWE